MVLSVSTGLHGPGVKMSWILKENEKFYSQNKEEKMVENGANTKFPL